MGATEAGAGAPVPQAASSTYPDGEGTGVRRPLHRPLRRRRAFVVDARDENRYLRTTWHREKRVFVVSTWTRDVCTGSIRIPVEQAPELITLLAEGMGDAVAAPSAPPEAGQGRRSGAVDRILRRLGLSRARSPRPPARAGATVLKLDQVAGRSHRRR